MYFCISKLASHWCFALLGSAVVERSLTLANGISISIDSFQKCMPSAAPITGVLHYLGTFDEHVLDTRAVSALGVNSARLASRRSAAPVLGEDSDPIPCSVPKKMATASVARRCSE